MKPNLLRDEIAKTIMAPTDGRILNPTIPDLVLHLLALQSNECSLYCIEKFGTWDVEPALITDAHYTELNSRLRLIKEVYCKLHPQVPVLASINYVLADGEHCIGWDVDLLTPDNNKEIIKRHRGQSDEAVDSAKRLRGH